VGAYTVDLGVFDSGWTHNYYWNGGAASITLETTPSPAAPTGLTATAANAKVGLTWTASSGATSYNVYRGTAAGAESTTALKTGLTTTAFTDTGVTNGMHYYYKVSAVNTGGDSSLSNEASGTPEAPPATPAKLTATAGTGEVVLSWTASTGATSYNVYKGTTAGGENATPITTGLTGITYTNAGLTKGDTYFYKVAAVNVGGTSGLAGEVSASAK
jgi:fibronectin type 3 domain-containing protein